MKEFAPSGERKKNRFRLFEVRGLLFRLTKQEAGAAQPGANSGINPGSAIRFQKSPNRHGARNTPSNVPLKYFV